MQHSNAAIKTLDTKTISTTTASILQCVNERQTLDKYQQDWIELSKQPTHPECM